MKMNKNTLPLIVLSLLFMLYFAFEADLQKRTLLKESIQRLNALDSVVVDNVYVSFSYEDKNYLIACILSEIGNWKDTDYEKMKQKAVAMTYVIRRRAQRGDFGGGHSIKNNILAPNQFYGMTLNTNPSPFKGKPCAHVALSILDPVYKDRVEAYFEENPLEFVRIILHLLPSDTTTGEDAKLFAGAFETVKNTVDGFLAGELPDNSNGALYFGYVGDIYSSKYHKPERMVAVVGGLGPYKTKDELLADPNLKRLVYRFILFENRGVDAIFFYK